MPTLVSPQQSVRTARARTRFAFCIIVLVLKKCGAAKRTRTRGQQDICPNTQQFSINHPLRTLYVRAFFNNAHANARQDTSNVMYLFSGAQKIY